MIRMLLSLPPTLLFSSYLPLRENKFIGTTSRTSNFSNGILKDIKRNYHLKHSRFTVGSSAVMIFLKSKSVAVKPTDRLIDWSTNWQTDWLTDQLTDWLTHRPTDWKTQTNRLTDRQTNQLTDRLTYWPTDWLTDRPTDRPTARLTYRPTNWQANW